MASFDEAAILSLGMVPISDAARAGLDVSDDEEYLLVEAEIAKLERIDLGEPDWFRIEQAALNILRLKAKDVQIACALGFALFKKQRYAGLSAALGLDAELIKNFWEGLYPERPRRRKTRLEAFAEQLVEGGWFRDAPPRADEFDDIDRCLERAAALDTGLKAAMPDDPPDFGKFVRKLKELAAMQPTGEPGGQPPPPPPPPPPTALDPSAALSRIFEAAEFLRKTDPTDPIPYSVVRLVKWAKLRLPTTDVAMHQIDPPEKTLVETLTHQFNNGVWENLLKNAEAAFRSNDPLWLDLQRYVCAAMKGLGEPYARAREDVMNIAGGLVRRLGSGIYSLTFRNGTPLCSGETKLWLETEVLALGGGATAGASGSAASNGQLTEATDAARKLAATGKLNEAVKTLQAGLETCAHGRDRLLWRLRLAQLCFDAQRLQLAAPLLEECHAELCRYHIDAWEPSLAIEVAQTLYRCRKALNAAEKQPTAEALAGVRESYAWLCQLDPLAALAAEPAAK